MDSVHTNCLMDSIRKHTGTPAGSPSTVAWAPLMLFASYPHTLPQYACLPVRTPKGSRCEPLQMANEREQTAGLTVWNWEKAHKVEHSALPYGKQTGGCQ